MGHATLPGTAPTSPRPGRASELRELIDPAALGELVKLNGRWCVVGCGMVAERQHDAHRLLDRFEDPRRHRGWWPSGEQSITHMASQRRRKYSRIRWKPGPSRNPATLMKQITPRSAAGWWSKTFHVAHRQK